MTWLMVTTAVAGWVVALVLALLLPSWSRRRFLVHIMKLRAQVVPYLQRRSLEAQIDPPALAAPHDPREVIEHICQMTARLTDQERSQMALGDTVNLAVSDTMPIKTLSDGEE